MSYIINKYNGDQVAVVADGTIDTTLDIKLIGKNYAGYGETQNENFVFLLENFSNVSAPPKPIKGQIWFDSGTNKLKFYDSSKWRTTGGAEVGNSAPTGLTPGDFWWDTLNKQLKAFDGTNYVLIGPQSAGTATTEMQSRNVQDTFANSHPIIEGIINGETVFAISHDSEFQLDDAVNAIAGFSKKEKGITLKNTPGMGDSDEGVTQTDFRFWGTSTNADRLGGYDYSQYVRAGSAAFNTLVNFADVGYTVGNPNQRLRVFNDGESTPTIYNQLSSQIVFKTTTTGNVTQTPMILSGANIIPGATLTSNLGSDTAKFSTVYAASFNGTATQADTLSVSGTYRSASTVATPSTIAVRTSTDDTTSVPGVTITAGALKATYFVGTATTAYYADLAEKYLADGIYEVGTVVMIGGNKEITACTVGSRALGAISENPAYMMNSDLVDGTYVALKGRVPVKVEGAVNKGDRLVAGENGTAIVSEMPTGDIFAIALETNEDNGIKIVEAVIL